MRFLPFLLLAGLSTGSGCPPTPVPTPPPDAAVKFGDMVQPQPNEYGLPTCPISIAPTIADVCDGMFVKSGSPGTGLACVHCAGAGSCYDSVDAMYCAKGSAGCLDDDACVQVNDGSDGVPTPAMRRSHKKPFKKIPSHMMRKP